MDNSTPVYKLDAQGRFTLNHEGLGITEAQALKLAELNVVHHQATLNVTEAQIKFQKVAKQFIKIPNARNYRDMENAGMDLQELAAFEGFAHQNVRQYKRELGLKV